MRARGEEGSGLLRTGLPAPRMYTAPAQLCPASEREGTKRQKQTKRVSVGEQEEDRTELLRASGMGGLRKYRAQGKTVYPLGGDMR